MAVTPDKSSAHARNDDPDSLNSGHIQKYPPMYDEPCSQSYVQPVSNHRLSLRRWFFFARLGMNILFKLTGNPMQLQRDLADLFA
jgi:hypothetical protein